jgi:mono/diheme cytochrome c family protein
MGLTLASMACALLASQLLVAQGAASGNTVWDGVFTDAQASRGEAAYARSCAACHKEDLLGGGTAPALAGEAFFRRWNEGTLDDVVQTMRSSMPQEAPNSLGAQVYVDIITYLLKASGSPTGSGELTTDRDRLKRVRVTAAPAR